MKSFNRPLIGIISIAFSLFLINCNISPSIDEFNSVTAAQMRDKEAINGQNIPLNDPEIFFFNGLSSGLYPWGNALIENDYKTNYINISKTITPLDKKGNPSFKGKIVMLGIGGSHAYIVYNGIKNAWLSDAGFGKNLVFANAGTGGKDLPDILDPGASYWQRIVKVLDSNRVKSSQVQVIFIIEDDFVNRDTTIQRAYAIKDQYITLLTTIRSKYPNCKMILVADRGYAGYSTLSKYDEPKGYLNGWAVKFVVEDFINGTIPQMPFINWFEYYWANGEEPRWDGLTYLSSDFVAPEFAHITTQKANELGIVTHAKLKADAGVVNWYY